MYIHMHTNIILTNKRCTHAQSNYTNTKLKAWFRRLLCRPARKRGGPILQTRTHTVVQPCNTYPTLADGWSRGLHRRLVAHV